MLPSKLPARGPLDCDECRVAALVLTAATFDDAWREVHAAGWMLVGTGGERWRLLCEGCRPKPTPGDPGAR